jgi:hypothetical protein
MAGGFRTASPEPPLPEYDDNFMGFPLIADDPLPISTAGGNNK